jgi:hypothetical protein
MTLPKVNMPEPQDLAIALLILGRDKYDPIIPADYISYFKQNSGENNVRDALITNCIITYWVKQTILYHNNPEDRRNFFEFFIRVAEVMEYVNRVLITWTNHHIHRNLINCVILHSCQQLSLPYRIPQSLV